MTDRRTNGTYDSYIQWVFGGSNTDGSFTMAVSNSFLSPLEQKPIAAINVVIVTSNLFAEVRSSNGGT